MSQSDVMCCVRGQRLRCTCMTGSINPCINSDHVYCHTPLHNDYRLIYTCKLKRCGCHGNTDGVQDLAVPWVNCCDVHKTETACNMKEVFTENLLKYLPWIFGEKGCEK